MPPSTSIHDGERIKCRECEIKDKMIRCLLKGEFKRVHAIIQNVCFNCQNGEPRKMFTNNFVRQKANACNNTCYLFANNLCETETGDGLCDREHTPRKVDEVAGKRVRFR